MAKILVDKDRLLTLEEVCKQVVKSSDLKVGTDYISDYEQASKQQTSNNEDA